MGIKPAGAENESGNNNGEDDDVAELGEDAEHSVGEDAVRCADMVADTERSEAEHEPNSPDANAKTQDDGTDTHNPDVRCCRARR